MPKTCIALFSGGLDSLLVIRLMAIQGLNVVALNSVNCFHGTSRIEEKKRTLRETALAAGARDIVFPDITGAVVELTKHPRHGYGRHLNACIDCRLHTVRTGFRVMRETGADFVVSGEVVGQRPMSQRRDAIALANREIAAWGHDGLFLRPLCAKLVPQTIPEQKGWVDPQYLYDISGRGRERQMALADELGITDYPTPAGGCLLTDPGFGNRLAVLARYTPDWTATDAELLKIGRPFQITPETRVVVSRCEEENYRLRDLSTPDDLFFINAERNGAVVMLRGAKGPEAEALAAGLAVYYSKMREEGRARVETWHIDGGKDVPAGEFEAVVTMPDDVRAMENELTGGNSLKLMRMVHRNGT